MVVATLLSSVVLVSARGSSVSASVAPADSARALQLATAAPDPQEVRLGLAGMQRRRGDVRGVVEALEGLDFTHGPSFAGADRAAFLLAQAYGQLGDRLKLEALAAVVESWRVSTTYTRLIAFEREFGDNAAPRRASDSADAGDTPPLGLYASALRGAASGADDPARWVALADADTSSDLGRDLAGAALVHLAALAQAKGEDARPWLERVPPGCRYHTRALHLRGLAALERCEPAIGTALLTLALADSTYGAHREVLCSLAGAAMEGADWSGARAFYEQADRDWAGQRSALRVLQSRSSFEVVWAAWQANPDSSGVLVIDAAAGSSLASRYADASADLVATWSAVRPEPGVPSREHAPAQRILPPAAGEWSEVASSSRRLAAVRGELERARWAADRESEALADRRRYLGLGLDEARARVDELSTRFARLESLRGTTDSMILQLRWPRDAGARRLAWRLAGILEESRTQETWTQGMRQLYVCGPDSARLQGSREGLPGPAGVLAAEQVLHARLRAEAKRLLDTVTAMPGQSNGQGWGVRFADLLAEQAEETGRQAHEARTLAASLDSSIAASRESGALVSLRVRATRLGRTADSLAVADAVLRARVAGGAVARTLAAIERERESIDYGLAASSYALALGLAPRDTVQARAAAVPGEDASLSRGPVKAASGYGDEREPAEALRWRTVAMPALRGFLAAHPNSPARAEVRFRLAELEQLAAHEKFREQMAAFLGSAPGASGPRAALPVLDPGPALALYRQILAEDPAFEHLDAVRYNAATILADAGDREAQRFFHDLVTVNPGSAYEQEAWLRMGDLAFDDRRFPESVQMYAHASGGGEPTLCAMANYKLGWAQFNQDHFLLAADAFRAVLDLYGARHRQIGVDIEAEAEEYLVNSLAGAGGAPAFGRYFDRVGPRPYERRTLVALGELFRHYGKYRDAAVVDEMVLARMANQPEALAAVRRLVETQLLLNRASLASDVRMAYVARFAPGGAWYEAQETDFVRAAGEAFARESYLAEVAEHHERAMDSNSPDEWRRTQRAYESLLAQWPDDPDAARYSLGAGEASLRLGNYPAALKHFALAEQTGPDSSDTPAELQRVAAADAWYESTRSGRGTGSDSLARVVLATADAFLARFPRHARSADIVWRASQLAIAHGWDDRATADLERMITLHPGDPRTPLAANGRGEACFRLGRFVEAGAAFEVALASARAQGLDSLVRRVTAALPVCAYRAAEAAVASDSSQYEKHATLFETVATRWPECELAPRALYRAGLAYNHARLEREAVRALQALVQRYPQCEYVSEARLRVAKTWEDIGEPGQAAEAYLEFSSEVADHERAEAAWLKAIELFLAAGQDSRADELRLEYVRRYPNDVESAMEISEDFARRELAGVGPGRPVSALLGGPRSAGRLAAPGSYLASYLVLAQAHPALASRALIAQVRFAQGEEVGEIFAGAFLTQPIAKSIPAKMRMLDTLLVCYRRSAELGVAEWAHASAFRMGQALENFAESLERSDPPADLTGDDLRAYQGVLADRAREFSSRGQEVWTELLRRQPSDGSSDTWLEQARSALWQRFAYRFLFRPEVQFPLVSPDDTGREPGTIGEGGTPAGAHSPGQREKESR